MTAGGVELGTGYVSLVPSTDQFGPGVDKALGQAQGGADSAGRSMGSRFAAGFTGVFKSAVTAGGLGAAVFGGAALKSGLSRLTTIQNATTSLTTIMGDAAQAGQLMEQVKKTVNGTPFNLDQFADVAKNLVAMNVPAAKVPGYLTAIGEAAAASGKGAEGVSQVADAFGKMAATGKVSLDEVWTVSHAGVDALGILANGFGVTTDEMQKMISKGAVPADRALDLLADGIVHGSDGAAGATVALAGTMAGLRKTLTGASGGFKSAMARFGAGVLAPWVPVATTTLTGLAGGLDTLTPKIQAFMQRLADSGAVERFTTAMANLPATIDQVTNRLGGLDFSTIKDQIGSVVGSLTQLSTTASQPSGEGGGGFWSSVVSGISGLGSALGSVGVDAVTVLTAALKSLSDVLTVLADHVGLVTPLLIAMAAAYATSQTVQTAYQAAKVIQTPAMFAQLAVQRQLTAALAQHTAALSANTVATGVNTGAQTAQTATTVRARVAALASAAASRAAAAAQWLWNAALTANPIGLVIAAIAALVAGLVWFFTQTETGRRMWETVWGGIQVAVSAAWSYIKPIWDGFLAALGWIGDKLGWLWSNVVSPVLGWIGSAFSAWWAGVQVYLGLWRTGLSEAGDVVSGWWSFIQPIFGFVADLVSAWWSGVQVYLGWWKTGLTEAGTVVSGFADGVQAGWRLIGAAIETGKRWFTDLRDVVVQAIGKILEYWDKIKGIVGTVGDVAGKIGGAIGSAVTHVIPGLAQGGSVNGLGGGTSDSIPALLSAGEHVVTAREVAAVGGHTGMYRLRAAMRAGALRFAGGGAVPHGIRDALAAARRVTGHPYLWGGIGPDRFDCSGFISFLQRVAMGMADPARRLYTTLDLLAGRLAGLESGLGPPGTLFQVGANEDHMAATIDGEPAEAGGSHGTSRLGPPAVGAADPQFTRQFHLPNELIAGWADGARGDAASAAQSSVRAGSGTQATWTEQDETKLASAQTAVEQAKARRDKVYADNKKTDADRRQADLTVEKAEQKVVALQKRKDDVASGAADAPPAQAPALERRFTEEELARIDAQAAVDSASERRNEVSADLDASPNEKLKADAELSRAQDKLDELTTKGSKVQGRIKDFVTDVAGMAFDAVLAELPGGIGQSRWWSIDYSPLVEAGQSLSQRAAQAVGPLPVFTPEAISAQLGYTPVAGQPPPPWWDKLRPKVFDTGGWLRPGEVAINLSRRPEPVLSSPAQMQAFLGGFAPAGAGVDASVRIDTLHTGMSAAEFRREWAAMQLAQRQRAKTWTPR